MYSGHVSSAARSENVHDRAATLHVARSRLRAEEWRAQIERHDVVPLARRDAVERRAMHLGGGVHEYIQRATVRGHVVDETRAFPCVAEIRGDGPRVGRPGLTREPHRLFGLGRGCVVVHGDAHPLPCERERDRATHAAPRAGDERDAADELHASPGVRRSLRRAAARRAWRSGWCRRVRCRSRSAESSCRRPLPHRTLRRWCCPHRRAAES